MKISRSSRTQRAPVAGGDNSAAMNTTGGISQQVSRQLSAMIALATGLLMLAISVAMLIIQPRALPSMPEGFLTPVLALEFVADFASAKHLLGQDQVLLQAFTSMTHWDMVFLLSYGAFLVSCVCVIFAKGVLRNIALAFAIIAPLADLLENLQLLQVLHALDPENGFHGESPIDFFYLRLAVVIKFGAIALVHVRLLRPLLEHSPLGKALAGLMMVNVFATGASFYNVPYAIEVTMNSIALCWLLQWVLIARDLRSGRISR